MSTAELRELMAGLVLSQKDTDRQIKELGKQIGGLGNKFGSFAEGLAYRSIARILRDDFGMNDFIAPGVQVRKDGKEEEYDVLAYSNGGLNRGMIVEIKSHLDERVLKFLRSSSVGDASAIGRSHAAKNDGHWNAAIHAVCALGRSVWFVSLLASGKYCRIQSTISD